MGSIRMTPESARVKAGEISNCREEVDTTIRRLENIITVQLREEWEGAAQRSFEEQFLELKNTVMKEFSTLLENISVQLKSVADAVEQADNDIARQIGAR